jgi:hypothetical protein
MYEVGTVGTKREVLTAMKERQEILNGIIVKQRGGKVGRNIIK